METFSRNLQFVIGGPNGTQDYLQLSYSVSKFYVFWYNYIPSDKRT